jgi:hypothetical protein
LSEQNRIPGNFRCYERITVTITSNPRTESKRSTTVTKLHSGERRRESTFELHANGGIPAWRGRLRRSFTRYNELANAVLRSLSLDMPAIDLSRIREIPLAPRRQIAPPPAGGQERPPR